MKWFAVCFTFLMEQLDAVLPGWPLTGLVPTAIKCINDDVL
jgi:hypothetical protein